MIKVLLGLVLGCFILGQFGRVPLGTSITLNLLDIAVLLFSVAMIVRMAKLKKIDNHWSTASKAFLAFILVGSISLVLQSFSLETQQITAAVLYMLRWILYMSLGITLLFLQSSEKDFLRKGMLIAGTIIVLIGYIQYFLYPDLKNLYYLGWDDHLYRMFGIFLDPNYAGGFFVLFLFFLLSNLNYSKNMLQKNNAFLLLGAVITFAAVFLTYSRTALVMLLVSSVVTFFLMGKKKIILIVVGAVLIIYSIFAGQLEGLNPFRTASIHARLESVNNAVEIIKESPLLGVGFNAYRYAQLRYGFRTGQGALESHSEATTDNSYLFVLATTGIVGFLFYLWGWGSLIQTIYVNKKKGNTLVAIMLLATFIGLFVGSFFTNLLFYTPYLTWIMMVISLTQNKRS